MKTIKKYLIQFEKTEQVTEDSWRIIRPSLEVDSDEKLEDIIKWVLSKNHRFPSKLEIIELETLSKLTD